MKGGFTHRLRPNPASSLKYCTASYRPEGNPKNHPRGNFEDRRDEVGGVILETPSPCL